MGATHASSVKGIHPSTPMVLWHVYSPIRPVVAFSEPLSSYLDLAVATRPAPWGD